MIRSLTQKLLAPGLALFLLACGGGAEGSGSAKAPEGPGAQGGSGGPGTPAGQDGAGAFQPGGMPTEAADMNAAAAGFYNQGLRAFVGGDLANAKVLFQQAIQADPKAHQAHYSLGTTLERLRDPGAAQSYKQAIALVPNYEPAIVAYGMMLAKKGQLGEADRFLLKKRGQMPKSAAVVATLAEIKSLQKDTGTAQRLGQEALKINPDYRPAMMVIARDHFRARRIDLALYALQAILDGFEPVSANPPRDKGNAEAHLLRGIIFREQGRRALAIDNFQKAVKRRPDFVEARVALATYMLEAGSAEEALPLLEGAIRFDAQSVPAHLNLGDAYRLLGRYGEAKKEFEWVLAKEPSMPQAHYDLGLLYLFAPNVPGMTAKQQIDSAQRHLTKYQELRPKGTQDDSDELLNAVKVKQGELQAAAAAAAPPPPEPAAPAAPAKTGAPASTAAPAAPPKK